MQCKNVVMSKLMLYYCLKDFLGLADMACSRCLTSVHFKMLHSKAVPGRVTAESHA